LLGKTVGRFRVLSLLGRGGMGEVYVAYDETLDRRVALKSIVAGRRLQPSAQARFRREARALSRLDHPNICRIYDYVEMESHDFLVLELVTGRRLDEAIRAGLSHDVQLRIAGQIASALVAAHAEGIVHRDLKPSNVMLSDSGEVKVLDFGLAWTAGERPVPQPLATHSSAAAETELPPTEAGFVGASALGVRDCLGERGRVASEVPSGMGP
jgi:serine/threonine protein kinase